MRKNPEIIRPRPDTISKVMDVIREHLRNAEDACVTVPVGKLSLTVSHSRGSGSCMSVRIDRTMSDRVDIVSRGGRFEVSFGPKLSIMDVHAKVKQFAGTRHGSRMVEAMSGDFISCSAPIFLSATLMSLSKFINYEGPGDVVHSSDYTGKLLKFLVIVLVRGAGGVEGSVDSHWSEPGTYVLRIYIPTWLTMARIKGSYKQGSFGSDVMDTMRMVVVHELTHMVDPGLSLGKYEGSPSEIMGMSDEDRRAVIMAAEASGDHASAQAVRDMYLQAYSKYASQPHELRAESSVALRYMRVYAIYWQKKNRGPMSPQRAMWVMNRDFENVLVLYNGMSERAKAKLQRYVIQALQEEGLVESLRSAWYHRTSCPRNALS